MLGGFFGWSAAEPNNREQETCGLEGYGHAWEHAWRADNSQRIYDIFDLGDRIVDWWTTQWSMRQILVQQTCAGYLLTILVLHLLSLLCCLIPKGFGLKQPNIAMRTCFVWVLAGNIGGTEAMPPTARMDLSNPVATTVNSELQIWA